MNLIAHSKPWITEKDLTAVATVLRLGMLAQGERTREFESLLGSWVCAESGAVAVGSGGAAIVLGLLSLNVKLGDEVIFPTYVCSSVLDAVVTVGATPILCDVGDEWVVRPENIIPLITNKTKALIVPHMYGIFADIGSFRQFEIPIIEDAAQAIDYWQKRKVQGDIAIFSFHPTKCLTTGEGGMAVSSDPHLTCRMRTIRDGLENAKNARLFSPMSNVSAALGISQLSRYQEALDLRREFASKYRKSIEEKGFTNLSLVDPLKSMFFRFPIKIQGGWDFYGKLFAEKNICIRRGVDMLLHRILGLPDDKYHTSVNLFNSTISLPIYPALTERELDYCVKSLNEILKAFHQQ